MKPRLIARILLWGMTGFEAIASESVFIFFPTTVRPSTLQKELTENGIDIIAFGRYSDFLVEVKANPPKAILALPEVIATLDGYALSVSSDPLEATEEPLFLLTLDSSLQVNEIGGSTIGMVDFLGRKGMQRLVAGFFPSQPTLKTVAKVEDLLPLLTFKMAQGILVTQVQAEYFKSMSRLNFGVTPVPNAKLGRVSLATRKGEPSTKVLQWLRTMDKERRKLLGGIQWE